MMIYSDMWSLSNAWYVLFLIGGIGSLLYGLIALLFRKK